MAEPEDIVTLIGRHVALKPVGKHLFGSCPFCADRLLVVSPERQEYKCFSCGAAGDAADFAARIAGEVPRG